MAENNWVIHNPAPVAGDIVSLDFVDHSNGWLVTDGGIVMRTGNGGRSWTRQELPQDGERARAVDFLNRSVGWILGGVDRNEPYREVVYHTTDAGNHWSSWFLGSPEQPCALTCLVIGAEDYGLVGGSASVNGESHPAVYRYLGEDEWESIVLPDGRNLSLNSLELIGRNSAWAAGQQGYLAATTDGGSDWDRQASGTEFELTDISFANPVSGWAVGGNFDNGVVLRTTTGGNSWTVLEDHPAENRLIRVHAISGREALAISSGWNQFPSVVIHTADGSRWNNLYENDSQQSSCSAYMGGNLWIGGSDGFLLHTTDLHEWTRLSTNLLPGNAYDVDWASDDRGICLGDSGVVLRTTNGGSNWDRSVPAGGRPWYCASYRNENTVWIAGGGSGEFRSTDGGVSWEQVEITDEDVTLLEFYGNYGYAMHGLSVAVTRDGGGHWESTGVIEGGRMQAIDLSVPEPRIAYVASTGDSLRRTLDGGESWTAVPAQANRFFGVSFIDRNRGWALCPHQMGGMAVLKTTDGGQRWETTARLDMVPSGILFRNTSQGWIWENPGSIYQTEDGGSSWANLRLNVDRSIRGAAIRNDGSLWICGEGGLIAEYSDRQAGVNDNYPEKTVPTHRLIHAYPNPTNSLLQLIIPAPQIGRCELSLYDSQGRFRKSWILNATQTGEIIFTVPLDDYPDGIYFVRLARDRSVRSRKLILLK